MNRKIKLVLLLVLSMTIAACGGNKRDTGANSSSLPTGGDTSGSADQLNAYGTGLSSSELADLGIIGDPLNYKILYFQYNSSVVDRKSDVIARAHARHLASLGGASVNLQGHADERGTRDYNLALGERRGQEIARIMNQEGAGSSTLQVISYGEERPANSAHNEGAWQENRRVEISY